MAVSDHDFRSEAKGLATPYGIYDTQANRGSVFAGISPDTPAFAVDAIARWCLQEGSQGRTRPPANSTSSPMAEAAMAHAAVPQRKRCKIHFALLSASRLPLSHYPPGTSKWNPIENRLFSQISRNWAGEPLTDIDKMLNFIRAAKTTTGLGVTADLITQEYETGIKISDDEMRELNLEMSSTLGRWNYTLRPHQNVN